MKVENFKGKIEKIISQSPLVKIFKISLDKEINFKAGQFINIILEKEGKKLIKPYSIASSPSKKTEIELCIRLIEDGRATPTLFKLKEGDELNLKGPLGLFNSELIREKKLVFIGAGTGIAPLKSMIIDLIEKKAEKEIMLIFGARHKEGLIFNKEFEDLLLENPNFKYLPLLSRPDNEWEGRIGYVQHNLEQIDTQNSQVFICGLPNMVNESKEKLINMGMVETNIHTEKYI